MIPTWYTVISWIGIGAGLLCSLIILIDISQGHRQHMNIMNLVWPITALFGSIVTILGYFHYGRLATEKKFQDAKASNKTPFKIMVAKAASHCGSGCTLGDILAEFLVFCFPVVATWVGWKTIFPDNDAGKTYSTWVVDFVFAFIIGIIFQYYTIKPMRKISSTEGIKAALKADTLSLISWQIGMYGCMAFINFYLAKSVWHYTLKPNMIEFWFSMQLAMICGFITSYPVNWWLLKKGIKEKM